MRRVVVTGIGMITPVGIGVQNSWEAIINSKIGIKQIDRFDTSSFTSKIAGLVDQNPETGFNPLAHIVKKDLSRMDLFVQYGISAAEEAISDSGLEFNSNEDLRLNTGVLIGSGIGGLRNIEITVSKYYLENKKVSPFFIPATLINIVSGHVAIRHQLMGPNHSVVTACATGTHAIGDAARLIQYGDADVMITGGSEAAIVPIGLQGFAACKALSTGFNDSPEIASRPWDKDRDGFVMGEGAGIVILEEYEHAKNRGAKIYAEILGYGLSGDGYHITSPHPEGLGAKLAITKALKNAKTNVEEIDYINAHGTSTPTGDAIELKAIEELFYNNSNLSMSSIKGSIGHLLGAAGGVETIISILALKNNILPPTVNLENPIDNVKIDLVPKIYKEKQLTKILKNSFGFGGTNASLVIGKI